MEDKMKSLITDMDLLVYIHDIIYLRDNNKYFEYTSTYKELHESTIITVLRYLPLTEILIISFIITISILRRINFNSLIIMYGIIMIISICFGILFVSTKKEFSLLIYQLKAKRAVQYALAHFNYEDFKYILDNYLSEESTKNYQKIYKL